VRGQTNKSQRTLEAAAARYLKQISVLAVIVVVAFVVYINCLPIWSKIGISNFANANLCAHLYNLHSHTQTHTDTHMSLGHGYASTFHFICSKK